MLLEAAYNMFELAPAVSAELGPAAMLCTQFAVLAPVLQSSQQPHSSSSSSNSAAAAAAATLAGKEGPDSAVGGCQREGRNSSSSSSSSLTVDKANSSSMVKLVRQVSWQFAAASAKCSMANTSLVVGRQSCCKQVPMQQITCLTAVTGDAHVLQRNVASC
jgi:hypothetical protein